MKNLTQLLACIAIVTHLSCKYHSHGPGENQRCSSERSRSVGSPGRVCGTGFQDLHMLILPSWPMGRWVIAWEKARQKWDFRVVFTNHSIIFNSVLLETREYFPCFWKVIPRWGRSPCPLLRALRINDNWNNSLSLYREAFWQLTLLFLHCALGNTWFLFWLSI